MGKKIMRGFAVLGLCCMLLILPVFQKYPFAQYEKDVFQNAEYFLGKLEEWKKSNKPVSFKLVKKIQSYYKIC